jgi:hypothetical protein
MITDDMIDPPREGRVFVWIRRQIPPPTAGKFQDL